MSANNKDRFEKKCELCHVRNAQLFSLFCEKCWEERRQEVKTLLYERMADAIREQIGEGV